MRAAWGNVPITTLPMDMGNKQMFVWEFVATPDQQWLLGAVQQYDYTKPRTQPAYLALYNIHTRQAQRIHTLPTLQSQVLGASADDHRIARSEADDAAYFDWTLFLYNSDTGQTKSPRFTRWLLDAVARVADHAQLPVCPRSAPGGR